MCLVRAMSRLYNGERSERRSTCILFVIICGFALAPPTPHPPLAESQQPRTELPLSRPAVLSSLANCSHPTHTPKGSLLVKHCQAEFKKNFEREDISWKGGSCLEPVRDVRVIDRLREEKNNAKPSCRSIHTIRFIGELFLSKVLGEKAMHCCIRRLLQNGDGPSLESLCELLQLIQQDLEVVTSREVMDSYYNQLKFVAEKGRRAPKALPFVEGHGEGKEASLQRLNNPNTSLFVQRRTDGWMDGRYKGEGGFATPPLCCYDIERPPTPVIAVFGIKVNCDQVHGCLGGPVVEVCTT
ncbi:unnamed protein product [Pleuronectes platessa]|uniref:MIF4G domain-containing protein n=1 Tax=Pleuronectes platessa TaxID=8262 RepID=A0A9N7Y5A8_PLEPL|nr:unnamed protein product [Pleuronectes platessa]